MNLPLLRNGFKPLFLTIALGAGSAFEFAYNDPNIESSYNINESDPFIRDYFNGNSNSIFNEVTGIINKSEFDKLFNSWESETMFCSFSNQITGNANFKKIVSMGKYAVPFIQEKLEEKPSLIVWALNEIYEKKISNNKKTTIEEACRLWIKALNKGF